MVGSQGSCARVEVVLTARSILRMREMRRESVLGMRNVRDECL